MDKQLLFLVSLLFLPFFTYAAISNNATGSDTSFIIATGTTAGRNWHLWPQATATQYYACADGEERSGAYGTSSTGCDWDANAVNGHSINALFQAGPTAFKDTRFYLSPGVYNWAETLGNCFGTDEVTCLGGTTVYGTSTFTILGGGNNTTSTYYTSFMSTSTDTIIGNTFNIIYLILYFGLFLFIFYTAYRIAGGPKLFKH